MKAVRVAIGGVPCRASVPSGGALLHVEWVTVGKEYVDWHPTVEGAKEALVKVADSHDWRIESDGLSVALRQHLTGPGSRAWIEIRNMDEAV